MVKEVSSAQEFDAELSSAGSKLVVVDFHAVWCGPCKVIAPVFQRLASQYTSVVFLKVDVDRVQPVAQRYSVRAMPTFLFLKNKSVVETLQGADPNRLTALVKQHSSGASSAFSGSGQTLSGSGSSSNSFGARTVADITDGHSSLLKTVEANRSSALNEKPDHRLQDILNGPNGGKWLESDADEQLLIHLSFKQRVKLSGILLRTLPSQSAHAPKQIKIFANRPGLSFDDATADTADQEAELSEEHVRGGENGGGGKVFSLRFVKFQKVDSLTIAVLSNQDDAETTRIDAIDVFGLADQATDMSELQKIAAEGESRDMDFRTASRTGLKGGSSSPGGYKGGFSAPRSSSIPNISAYAERPSRHGRSHSTSSLNPPMPKYRRSVSSASAPPMQLVDEEDEDEYVGSTDRRRSDHHQGGFAPSIPHSPPSMTEEEEAEFEAAQRAARDTLSGWHYAPLGVALAPPLGALLGGHSDAWSDAILLILASFWLYQFLRIPWEMYYASRTRIVLSVDQDDDDAVEQDGQDTSARKSPETAERKEARRAAAAELRRSELLSLVFCVLSPLVGAYMLHWMRETMTDGNKYLNTFNIRLFTLAAGIKPWSHAMSLIRRRMLHLQEEVHHPSSKVEKMNQRIRRLEADLSSLRKMYATKNELRVLRDHEAQLGRAVRRSERKEEHLRLSAEEKFSIVEGRLEDLLREVAINAELIEDERRERERAASARISLFAAIKYLIGSGQARHTTPKHYLHDMPRSLPSTASLGLGAMSPESEASIEAHLPSAASQSLSPTGPARTITGTPTSFAARDKASSERHGEAPSTTAPARPKHGNGNAVVSRSRTSNNIHHVSGPWWERGMAFYLFLPLNVSSAAIRFAGEKVKHILEDSEQEAARNQRKTLQYQKHLADQQLQQHQRKMSQQQQMLSPTRTRGEAPPSIKVAAPPAGRVR
ncbi:PITH domain protein [Kalmanozyma brasiliensis GHG001]|uniref:Thioredoxin n=1 Tax=Kalmanozyma brasiliensis (strain GHG001) TaxID=1365824 RepID=V5EU02_KALBG|nr:PITH domain protein [Kalmanozyma brasiliensis GHG001]EST08820.1 PITH domain protein [Kalmanozyma brasiliensis GHG001]